MAKEERVMRCIGRVPPLLWWHACPLLLSRSLPATVVSFLWVVITSKFVLLCSTLGFTGSNLVNHVRRLICSKEEKKTWKVTQRCCRHCRSIIEVCIASIFMHHWHLVLLEGGSLKHLKQICLIKSEWKVSKPTEIGPDSSLTCSGVGSSVARLTTTTTIRVMKDSNMEK